MSGANPPTGDRPRAAFATIARLAPEQQLSALFLQRLACGSERFIGRAFGLQLIGHRGGVTPGRDLAIETQLAADLADRAHRVDALDFGGWPVIDDFRVFRGRESGQILSAGNVIRLADASVSGQAQQQREGTWEPHRCAHRVKIGGQTNAAPMCGISEGLFVWLERWSIMQSPVSTRPASTVAQRKSRNGEEAIETVCNRARAGLVVPMQMMTAGQYSDLERQRRQQLLVLRQHALLSHDQLRRT